MARAGQMALVVGPKQSAEVETASTATFNRVGSP